MAQSYQAFDASSLQPFGASTPRMRLSAARHQTLSSLAHLPEDELLTSASYE
ncbi:BQ5605_C003g02414 [Microbotryum silenes-dioicae]|uniref:BQ5605_C003g02414 protein n=1 Tax=Microbotryum silenes-dioicae TaxID=796604 RepID=A0A2X0M539_9BASI|nr:BQ5605_C003g02414 [Microbotryum silenes-dioicae]